MQALDSTVGMSSVVASNILETTWLGINPKYCFQSIEAVTSKGTWYDACVWYNAIGRCSTRRQFPNLFLCGSLLNLKETFDDIKKMM
jgi:hypothetical protein